MEIIGLVIAGVVALPIMVVVAVSIAIPLFWVWMLVDSILRETWEYPSDSQNEKLLWIVLMIVFQLSAVAYYFLVFREIKRGEAHAGTHPAAPAPPAPA